VSVGRSLGDGSLPLRGALSSSGSLVKSWLGKDQYGTDSLRRYYRACRLVLALAGSKLARQTLMLIPGLIAAALLLALWFFLRSA